MNWFEKHLNWTLFLALVGVLICICGSFLAAELTFNNLLSPGNSTFGWPFLGFLVLCGFVLSSAVTLWVIQGKGRSRWNVIWFLLPMGFVVILALKNHRESKP